MVVCIGLFNHKAIYTTRSVGSVFQQMSTIQAGEGCFLAWQLSVRCDDFKNMCPCNINTGAVAYTDWIQNLEGDEVA